MLKREDKIWLSKLAALLLRGIVEATISRESTRVAIYRYNDILDFGQTDKSKYYDEL